MSEMFEVKLTLLEELFPKVVDSSPTCFSLWTGENLYGGDLLLKQSDSSALRLDLKPKLKRQHPSNAEIIANGKKSKVAANKRTCVDSASFVLVTEEVTAKVDVSSMISIVQNLKSKEKEFRCSMCPYVTKQIGNAKRHVELNHLERELSFRCLTCQEVFSLKANLKRHYIKVHKMLEEAAKAMLAGQC